jgi:hypothetical protein
VKQIQDSTKKHIRRKLEAELGESINIFPDNRGKLLVVPNSVSFRDVVVENHNLHQELKTWKTKSTDIEKTLDKASLHIRSIIKHDMKSTPWPLHPADMKTANITIPSPLKRFLLGVLVGDPDSKQQTERIRSSNHLVKISFMLYHVVNTNHRNMSFFPML